MSCSTELSCSKSMSNWSSYSYLWDYTHLLGVISDLEIQSFEVSLQTFGNIDIL